jgi:hypothetical protein
LKLNFEFNYFHKRSYWSKESLNRFSFQREITFELQTTENLKRKSMTEILPSSKAPKVKYKNQLRDEMMKTFSRFFQSGESYDDLGSPSSTNPGDPVIDIKKHIEQLSQPAPNSFDQKDGFDTEFDVTFIFLKR